VWLSARRSRLRAAIEARLLNGKKTAIVLQVRFGKAPHGHGEGGARRPWAT